MGDRLPLLIRGSWWPGALATAIACAGSACVEPALRELHAAPPGATATSWATTPLVTLDGRPTDLHAALGGRVAVVNFWATWCEACVREIGAFERLEAQADDRVDGVVIGVAVGESRETVAAFARAHPVAYAQLVDPDFRLADALGQSRVPTTLIIDRAERIVFRGGGLDAAALRAFRATLASAGPLTSSTTAPEEGLAPAPDPLP